RHAGPLPGSGAGVAGRGVVGVAQATLAGAATARRAERPWGWVEAGWGGSDRALGGTACPRRAGGRTGQAGRRRDRRPAARDSPPSRGRDPSWRRTGGCRRAHRAVRAVPAARRIIGGGGDPSPRPPEVEGGLAGIGRSAPGASSGETAGSSVIGADPAGEVDPGDVASADPSPESTDAAASSSGEGGRPGGGSGPGGSSRRGSRRAADPGSHPTTTFGLASTARMSPAAGLAGSAARFGLRAVRVGQ